MFPWGHAPRAVQVFQVCLDMAWSLAVPNSLLPSQYQQSPCKHHGWAPLPSSLPGKSSYGKLLLSGCSNLLLSLLLVGETEAWICTMLHKEMGSSC